MLKGISYFLTKSLSIKQAKALEFNNITTLWFLGPKHTSIIKQGEEFEEKIKHLLGVAHDINHTIPIVVEKTHFLTHYPL